MRTEEEAAMENETSERALTVADVQAIADAVSLQMLTLPRELGDVIRPHQTGVLSLDFMTKDRRDNLQLRLLTDADGLFMEFTMYGQQRLALLRFNYRGWAWK